MDSFNHKILYSFAIILGSFIIYQFVFWLLKQWGKTKNKFIPGLLRKYSYWPGLFFYLAIAVIISLTYFEEYLDEQVYNRLHHAVYFMIVITAAWGLMRFVTIAKEISLRFYQSDDPLDFRKRKLNTKFSLIQQVLNFVVISSAIIICLLSIEAVKQFGNTILASAGVIGIILGFAAQKSLSTLFAGIQIAFSEPIRIDDIVIVEGQYGVVAEITLTYAVLNLWDERCLIVPINFFIDKSFENWTRNSPELVGKIYLFTDYTIPIDEIRNEFHHIVENSPLWDKRAKGFKATDNNEKYLELRGSFTCTDSGNAFDLECELREKLIEFIKVNYPESLPRTRIELPAK